MKKQSISGKVSELAKKNLESFRKHNGLNTSQALERVLEALECDNKTTTTLESLGIGDRVPKHIQADHRITQIKDGDTYYVYPRHKIVARIVGNKLVVVNVFTDKVWLVAQEHPRFSQAPLKALEVTEMYQSDLNDVQGWSRDEKIANGVPVNF